MDPKTADKLEKELVGRQVGGWTIEKLLGSGMSAAVFRASKDGKVAAIKLFDPEFVGTAKKDLQLNRIARELSLRGKHHKNLVRIYDGGECKDTGYLYVVMEYLTAKSLFSRLQYVPRDRIRSILAQVASAAQFLLEDVDIVHRDIKTDNIAIDESFETATLLDLGVVKPLFRKEDVADLSGDAFLGTTRYAPPEFLFGQAEVSKAAFRAITFYQLGGVLYDLLKKQRLFGTLERHKLVWAIEHKSPDLDGADGPEDLILLSKDCLIKDAESRLRYVTWDRFLVEQIPSSRVEGALARIVRRTEARPAQLAETAVANWEATVAAQEVASAIHRALKKVWRDNRLLPRIACREGMPRDGRCFVVAEIEPPNPNLPLHRVFVGISVTIEDAAVLRRLPIFSYNQGLGRLIHRELCRETDPLDVPSCDIAVNELEILSRTTGKFPEILTASASYADIELAPCVTCSFSRPTRKENGAKRVVPPQIRRTDNAAISRRLEIVIEALESLHDEMSGEAEQLLPFDKKKSKRQ